MAHNAARINREIDRLLMRDAHQERTVIKLLLLGTAECGKSTILKQMRILHDSGFREYEYEAQRHIICENMLETMAVLVETMERTNTAYQKIISKAHHAHFILTTKAVASETAKERDHKMISSISQDLADAMRTLWEDPGIRRCVQLAEYLPLGDSTSYFFDAIDRIATQDYWPSLQDMIMSRVATIGVAESRFSLKGLLFRVFDVGGQRTQRRKWIHCFDNVTTVIFIVAISEYDMALREDPSVNRIHEALHLFNSLFNCVFFAEKSFILFLNKRDLFAEKIKKSPLTIAFPFYAGKQVYDDAVRFLKKQFEAVNLTPALRSIYTHQTCGTDTNQVHLVLDASLDSLIAAQLKSTALA